MARHSNNRLLAAVVAGLGAESVFSWPRLLPPAGVRVGHRTSVFSPWHGPCTAVAGLLGYPPVDKHAAKVKVEKSKCT